MNRSPLSFHFDPENYSNYRFASDVALEIPDGALILDVGAGKKPYEHLHAKHKYIATDYGGEYTVSNSVIPNFYADTAFLPVQTEIFDSVICYQVLEHVPYPSVVLEELYRILRPGGMLYLTVPQGWGLHHAPHHYFNFTRFGLALLFDNAGFINCKIEERGGIFWMLAKRIRILPHYILFQYIYPLFRPKKAEEIQLDVSRWRNFLSLIVLVPLTILAFPLLFISIPILFYIDRFDKQRLFCLGYQCRCQKPWGNN